MIKNTLKFIGSEWKLCVWFSILIVLLTSLSQLYFENTIINVLIFCVGLDLYNKFLFTVGKIYKGEIVENPYKSILFNKDRNGYDFIILLVFFGAIILVFKGPVLLFNVLMADKLNDIISSLEQWIFLINITLLIIANAYKIALLSAVANISYYGNEVLEAFIAGIKGVWNFKVILILLVVFQIAMGFLVPYLDEILKDHFHFSKYFILFNYLFPAFLMLFMISFYNKLEKNQVTTVETE